jgi:hypothetical protein
MGASVTLMAAGFAEWCQRASIRNARSAGVAVKLPVAGS